MANIDYRSGYRPLPILFIDQIYRYANFMGTQILLTNAQTRVWALVNKCRNRWAVLPKVRPLSVELSKTDWKRDALQQLIGSDSRRLAPFAGTQELVSG